MLDILKIALRLVVILFGSLCFSLDWMFGALTDLCGMIPVWEVTKFGVCWDLE